MGGRDELVGPAMCGTCGVARRARAPRCRRTRASSIGTPVAWLAPRLLTGEEVMRRGRVATLDDLGALETVWSDLRTVRSATPKHLVAGVYATPHDPRCTDDWKRHDIDRYLAMLRAGEPLELRVTVRLDPSGRGRLVERIYDGNTRCGALFEHRRRDVDRVLGLDVFVTAPPALMAFATRA